MSKLDEIKADLAVYEKELAEHDRYIQDATDRGELVWGNYPHQNELNKAWDALHRNAPDYLRLLLPIVEAAIQVEAREYVFRHASEIDGDCTCGICGGDWSRFDLPQHEEDCAAKLFLEALAKLKE